MDHGDSRRRRLSQAHELLSPEQVVALLPGVTKGTLAMWRYEHKGPKYFKLGRKVVYALDELEEWLAASAAGAEQD
ncbi:helix-turn-helix transcriptional regulator [Microbacterium trichothecenolyticum]|uniref:helix-turn-helix transcriptional regulator n=1 Tax=Microbacterium trichothecenolyticum TaxID=69370 RepID=UPI0005ECB4BF|nr:helix-turn-helix domain-containing protein [Microbacterium trichothecenolyticum]